MGIYIEGLEMPKEGQLLYIDIYPDGKVARDFDMECKQIAIAHQVPAHGRLVDAEKLHDAMYHRAFETDGDTMWQSGCWVRYRAIEQTMDAAPTVIPPEGGGARGD